MSEREHNLSSLTSEQTQENATLQPDLRGKGGGGGLQRIYSCIKSFFCKVFHVYGGSMKKELKFVWQLPVSGARGSLKTRRDEKQVIFIPASYGNTPQHCSLCVQALMRCQ